MFKILFWMTTAFGLITLITNIACTVLCKKDNKKAASIVAVITLASYFCLLLSLLATLYIRLETTFHGTIYELSKPQSYCLLTLFCITLITAITGICLFSYVVHHGYWNPSWLQGKEYEYYNRLCLAFGSVAGLLYIFTAVWSAYLFAMKLVDVASLGEEEMTSMARHAKNTDADMDANQFTQQQIKYLDSISRYVTLFSIATIGSLTAILVLGAAKWWPENEDTHGTVYMIISGADTVLNLICLYLQYQFNVKYYKKFCGCLGCWKTYFVQRVRANMQAARKRQRTESAEQRKPLNTTSTCDTQQVTAYHEEH